MIELSEFSDLLHAEKYRVPSETFEDAMNRIAATITDDSKHYHALREILLEQRFLPGGRIQAAMGSTKVITPFNCYVSGTIEDSFTTGHGNIMNRATEAAETMRMGGGIGYDFSTLRPRGARITKLDSYSSGAVSFMGIFNAVCATVSSAGHRRGAQMGMLRIDHPDIEEFVAAKHNTDKLTNFNISVAVTNEFMSKLESQMPFNLKFDGKIIRQIDPLPLWETIMRSNWDWGEPGVIFIDRINEMNNLHYCEKIAATNPCGEQPLPPYGACLLGSFNLLSYINDLERLRADIPIVVRAMDNVIDVAKFPLYEQEREAKSKRRMGLGVTGVANAIEQTVGSYGSAMFNTELDNILHLIKEDVYKASSLLAKDKGSFPLFDSTEYMKSRFIKTLFGDTKSMISKYGIRNSHLLSIAPTGTISLCANNISSGIEPVYADENYQVQRTINMSDGVKIYTLEDRGYQLNTKGKLYDKVTAKEHIDVLTIASKHVDSSVSKTVNVSNKMPWADFKDLYVKAFNNGCKGLATFRDSGKRQRVLQTDINDDVADAMCYVDPVTGQKECE